MFDTWASSEELSTFGIPEARVSHRRSISPEADIGLRLFAVAEVPRAIVPSTSSARGWNISIPSPNQETLYPSNLSLARTVQVSPHYGRDVRAIKNLRR
jgi:hypothetical protein